MPTGERETSMNQTFLLLIAGRPVRARGRRMRRSNILKLSLENLDRLTRVMAYGMTKLTLPVISTALPADSRTQSE